MERKREKIHKTRITLSRTELVTMIKRALCTAKKKGREICGFLIDISNVLHFVEVRNKIKNGGGFAFYVSDVRNLVKAANVLGFEVVGTFHSHPFYIAKPGDGDIMGAPDDSLMLIIDTTAKHARLWHIKNLSAKEVKYIQR